VTELSLTWSIVLAELREGTASVGIRFDTQDTVHFFELHKQPAAAAQIVADIANGKITLRDIANYDWKAVTIPYREEQPS